MLHTMVDLYRDLQASFKNYCLRTLTKLIAVLTLCKLIFVSFLQYIYVFNTAKVKFSDTRFRGLGPELIPVYRQSARR